MKVNVYVLACAPERVDFYLILHSDCSQTLAAGDAGQRAHGNGGIRRRPPPGPGQTNERHTSNHREQGAGDSASRSHLSVNAVELATVELEAAQHNPYTEPCITVTYASDYQASESPKSASPATEFSKRKMPPLLQHLSPTGETNGNYNGPPASQSPHSPRVNSPRRW